MPTRLWLVVRLLFALLASYFSLLAQRTSNQKKVHPSFRLFPVLLDLPGVNQKLVLTSHTERGLLRDSNS